MLDTNQNSGQVCGLADFSNYPYRFDIPNRQLNLLSVPADCFRDAAFHDTRLEEYAQGQTKIPLARVEEWSKSIDLAEPRYIFHHAFTMSTLLGRIMDVPELTVSYREPLLLTELAAVELFSPDVFASERGREVFETLLSTLRRTDANDKIPIIKACDSVTNCIDLILQLQPQAKGILMFSDLSTFIVSCLKVPGRRSFARSRAEIFHLMRPNILGSQGVSNLNDHLVVAFLWYVQMTEFRHLFVKNKDQLIPMYCEDLFEREESVLNMLHKWSGISEQILAKNVQAVLHKGTHSKSGRTYDHGDRSKELSHKKEKFRPEILEAMVWLNRLDKSDWFTAPKELFSS